MGTPRRSSSTGRATSRWMMLFPRPSDALTWSLKSTPPNPKASLGSSRMGKILDWMVVRATFVVWGCAGILVGLGLRLPLGWHLPDTIANLLGGVVGAIASVAGAMLVVKRQLDAEEVRLRNERALAQASIEAELDRMRRALANALWTDLRSVRALIKGQMELATQK